MSKKEIPREPEKTKLTRAQRKEIDAVIRKYKGDGKPHTAQATIPYEAMYPDGVCRLTKNTFSKCIAFEDISYQLAQPDTKTAIFEHLCDLYNYVDASIHVQLSFLNRRVDPVQYAKSFEIAPQGDDFDDIRAEYTGILQKQLANGNNGIVKTKYLTFTNINHQLQRKRNMEYIIEDTKTSSGTRVVPMTDDVYECFKRIIANRKKPKVEPMICGKSGFLYLDKNDMPMVALHWEKYFQHICEKYNSIYKVQMPKITPHVCRHTFCSNMAKSGMNPKTLQYIMGHSDIGVTLNTYTHIGFEDAQEELQRVANAE